MLSAGMMRSGWPDDIESPNDGFVNHKLVEWVNNCNITRKTANLPFDIKTVEELTNDMVFRGAKGLFWIVGGKNVVAEMSKLDGFKQSPNEQIPLGCECAIWVGVLQKIWRVYLDYHVPANKLFIGAGFSKKPAQYYASLEFVDSNKKIEEIIFSDI